MGIKEAAGAAAIFLIAFGGMMLADRAIESELDVVRGVRVSLDARRGLEQRSRPPGVDGVLTVVRETESAKYPFLNKRSYVVHTASVARAGSVLTAADVEDKARADRHAEARRKKSIRERMPDGAWRATLSDGTLSAELLADPPPVPRSRPWTAAAIAFIAGLATMLALAYASSRAIEKTERASSLAARGQSVAAEAGGAQSRATGAGLRSRATPWPALAGILIAAGVVLFAASKNIAAASLAATAYLAESTASPPGVNILAIKVLAWPIALAIFTALLTLIALSARGVEAGRAMLRTKGAYAAIAPAMTGLAILIGIPFLFGIGLSLFEHQHGQFRFVGFENFARIFAPRDRPIFAPGSLLYALFVNVVWTISNVTFHVGIGLTLALLLEKHAGKWSKLYRIILIVPWAVPAYLTALIWKSMFDPDVGAINQMLGLQGMSWMHNPLTAFLANLMTNVWLGFPFMMVVCLGALTSIPKELYEAADVDGASAFQQLRRITLPLLKPALLPAVILGSIWTFNRFEIIFLVSEGRPDGATDILVTESYRWAFERGLAQGGAYGYAAAYSVVIFLVLLIYGWMTSRVAKAAEEALR